MHLIRRYSNRKLYSTHHSRYLKLEEIADLTAKGEDVRVIDHGTERDLTAATLAQVIADIEKRSPRIPVEKLREIIRSGLGAG